MGLLGFFICLLSVFSFLLGWAVVNFLVPTLIEKAFRWNVVDLPNQRRVHNKPTARLGGMGLFPVFWFGTSLAACVTLASSLDDAYFRLIIGLLVGGTGMFIVGCVDDFRPLNAHQKLMGQILSAWLALYFVSVPTTVFGFTFPTFVGIAMVSAWLVILTNSVNLLDGIDGLTSALVIVFCLNIMGVAVMRDQPFWFLISAPLVGGLCGFIKFNWRPAKIFLGDSGSLLLGFFVAYTSLALCLVGSGAVESRSYSWNPFMSTLMVSPWILDTTLAVWRRYWSRAPGFTIMARRSIWMYGNLQLKAVFNIFRPDTGHLHHRLLKMGWGMPTTCFILLTFSVLCFIASVFFERNMVGSGFLSASLAGTSLVSAAVVGLYIFLTGVIRPLKANASCEKLSEAAVVDSALNQKNQTIAA